MNIKVEYGTEELFKGASSRAIIESVDKLYMHFIRQGKLPVNMSDKSIYYIDKEDKKCELLKSSENKKVL